MKSKIISIRLRIDKLTDQKVDDILSGLPTRRKSEYIRNAIIAYNDFERLIEMIKQSFKEVIDERETIQAEKKNEENGDFYNYFKSL